MMQYGLWAAPVQEELQAKTVGLIGVGFLGMRLANLFRAFRVRQILGYSPVTNCRAFAAKDSVICKASLTDVFIDSDIICVCISLTPETQGLISEQLLGLLRPDSLLVSTSRGVIAETALSKMLLEKRFRAALDFTGTDPLEEGNPLRSLPAEQLLFAPPACNQNCSEARNAAALKSFLAFLSQHPVTCSDKEWFE
jgi:phosphoglycerate dehydrogenase-like enzyme